jgi:cytochrome P450
MALWDNLQEGLLNLLAVEHLYCRIQFDNIRLASYTPKFTVMNTETQPSFNPSFDPLIPHPVHVKDPYKVYSELRVHAPMYRSPHGIWIASRHKEMIQLLRDPQFGRGYFYFENMAERLGPSILKQPMYDSARNMMLMKDGNEHQRIRNLLEHSFSPKSIEKLRDFMQETINELIDNVFDKEEFDVMADLAFPLPSAVICHLLGVPKTDWSKFSHRSATGSRALEPAPLSPLELMQQNKSVTDFREYFAWLIEQKRKAPGNDLTSILVAATDVGNQITLPECIDNLRMMFIGGQETAVNTIGNGILALYQHPDQLIKLKDNPSFLASTIVEILRYDSPVQITPRQAREDVMIGGVSVKAKETILCILASANRDPEAWDSPDCFDISREASYPLSFGGGPHYCIGDHLGKLEAEVALKTIIHRLPNLHINTTSPQWLSGTVVFRGLKTLPATNHRGI